LGGAVGGKVGDGTNDGVLSLMGLRQQKAAARVKPSRCAAATHVFFWRFGFYAAPSGRRPEMAPSDEETAGSFDEEVDAIHAVVPARAVLTELARGFLLVHEHNPAQAVQFATTFLKERSGPAPRTRAESVSNVTIARLSLGRFPQGAVERLDP